MEGNPFKEAYLPTNEIQVAISVVSTRTYVRKDLLSLSLSSRRSQAFSGVTKVSSCQVCHGKLLRVPIVWEQSVLGVCGFGYSLPVLGLHKCKHVYTLPAVTSDTVKVEIWDVVDKGKEGKGREARREMG